MGRFTSASSTAQGSQGERGPLYTTSAAPIATTAYDKGTSAWQMGTYKSYKKQDLPVRKPSKKQDLSVRKKHKKPDHYWTRTSRRQSDTEIQKDFQLRFEILGGVGIVSPEKAILKCGTKTTFYGKNTNVGLPGVSGQKMKRWEKPHLI
jgi:hypothetical protein